MYALGAGQQSSSFPLLYDVASLGVLWFSYGDLTAWCVSQVGFGSGFKCNSAVWRALRTFNSQHAAWKHLAENGSTEQDSKLRVDVNTAEEAQVQQQSVKPLRVGQNGVSDDAESISDNGTPLCNGHTTVGQELKSNLKANQADSLPNGDAHLADSKAGKQGQLSHENSGIGEIKAHSHPKNCKQTNGTVAFL